ncbi:MAG: sigma-54-dependent Fis family transcriptional regulator, partial [bacterium]|nr:sigma-54-dependent Fis family transcriptional regulator [bacterium]
MTAAASILLVEDHEGTRSQLSDALESSGFSVISTADGREALEALRSRPVDLILSDYRMRPMDGLSLLRAVRKTLEVPFVLYSAGADAQAVFEAGREGAVRFLEFPFRFADQLLPTIAESLGRRSAAARDEPRVGAERLIGSSAAMRHVRATIHRLAPTRTTVLIYGETGTGKELVARAIHEESGRDPFVSVSVPELSEGLLESELFGHTRGAFTGAVASRPGLFEAASGGTLFLDEIGDSPMSVQVKLLRALETREIRPVGGATPRKVDVRVVAATNRDLAEMVRGGEFREDLFYRIRGASVQLPPLRSRTRDIEAIAQVLVSEIAESARVPVPKLDPGFLAALEHCPWKGNVRELRAVLENVILWRDGDGPLERIHLVEALVAMNPDLSSEDQLLAQKILDAFRR